MSYSARGYGQNGFKYFSNITKPQETFLQWTVTPSNGLGITGLKSNGYVRNVFMHTSTTPSANNGYTNPNPANGYALIQLQNNFNKYIIGGAQFQAPNTGSVKIDNSAMTAGAVYVITTLGDASLAKWQSIGVPLGVTPAVGVSFVALTNGGSGNVLTSRVSTPLTSGISGVEIVGNPNVMLQSTSQPTYAGAWLMLQFLGLSGTVGDLTFVGTEATLTGTNSAPTFTGSALGNHAHDLLVKGGQAASTSNNIANYAGPILGKEEATDATYPGGNATNGGVQNASAGTPAGSVSAPTLTMDPYTPEGSITGESFTASYAAAAPTTGTVISLRLVYDGSDVTIDGL